MFSTQRIDWRIGQRIESQSTVDSAKPDLQHQQCLLIKHSDGWRNDRCETWLKEHGATTNTVICNDFTDLPEVNNYARVIVYGGTPCINDADHKQRLLIEMQFIETALKNNIPCFGICLGAQLIAHVLGAEVKPLPCGKTEIGYATITPTDNGRAFMPDPCDMLQWHCEGFDLPQQCELLATGDLFPNQAFRYGTNTYGVQFHPEVTPSVLEIWHNKHAHHARIPVGEFQRKQQRRDCAKYARQNDLWFEHFMQLWISSDEHQEGTEHGV